MSHVTGREGTERGKEGEGGMCVRRLHSRWHIQRALGALHQRTVTTLIFNIPRVHGGKRGGVCKQAGEREGEEKKKAAVKWAGD